jgi:hypothetical protein
MLSERYRVQRFHVKFEMEVQLMYGQLCGFVGCCVVLCVWCAVEDVVCVCVNAM